MSEDERSPSFGNLRTIAIWIILPLLLGILVSFSIPQPVVGVIQLNDAIFSRTAGELIAQIEYARNQPEIRAVVLILDSPGGTVVDTEAVYLELVRLQQTKPVVTYVQGMAASGAYYLSVGTNYILAGPSSLIGNVGVIASLPPAPFILEDVVTTGPYKMFGSTRDAQLRELEVIKQGFYQAVTMGRGERLKIGPDVLLRGQIWPGSEATRLGLIDGLGSRSEALEYAARLAKIQHYSVAEIINHVDLPQSITTAFFIETSEGIRTPYPKVPDLYLLYIPPIEGRLP
jgi:protease-4